MNLDILGDLLVENGAVLEADLFLHAMPSDVERGILLRLPLDGVKRDPSLPDYYRTEGLQAIVRDTTHSVGEATAKLVARILTIYGRRFTADDGSLLLEIKQLYPRTLPVVYPLSEGGQVEWSLTFCAAYVQPDA